MSRPHGGFEEVREEVDGRPMAQLFDYVRPYWKRLTAAIFASFTMRVARLIPALTVAAVIDRILGSSSQSGLLTQAGLLPPGAVTTADARLALLYRIAAIAAAAYVLQALAQFASRFLFQSVAQLVQHDIRRDTYDHMQRLSMPFFDDHQTGAMMSILNSDVNRLENFFNTEIRQIIRAVVMVGVVGAVLLYLAPGLGVVALAPLPIIGYATARFMMWIEPNYKRIREHVSRLNMRLQNNLGGAAIIKSFDRYDTELDRVSDRSQAYRDEKIDTVRVRKVFFSSLRFVFGAVFVVVLIVGSHQVLTGVLTVGTLATVFLLLRRLDGPMQRVGKTANKYQKAKSSAERIFGVLGSEPAITPPESPVVPEDLEGRVDVEHVRFSYEGQDERVLDGVDLSVEAGQTVGLAGPSGSGKSTLLKLLPRLYDVDEGRVCIDGVDVRSYDVQALRDEIGIVEQSPYMFSGSVRENIAYGDRELFLAVAGGELDPETERRIHEAAEAAGAHEFVSELPEGYDTQVGERGVKLSGGQRQRLSIARALLNDPAIVVLDEATSDVDTETEELIQANLDRLCADRTAFIIAHRLSTIQDADRIVVLEDGEVTETGTHEELQRADGTYADLWASQAEMNTPA